MTIDARDDAGRFAAGNAGGPGRPRRATESRYMAALGDSVTVSDWREIVSRAVQEAKAGDARSREWLTRYLLGSTPPSLLSIAATEQRSACEEDDVEDEIDREATRQRWQQRDEEHCRTMRAALDAITERLPK